MIVRISQQTSLNSSDNNVPKQLFCVYFLGVLTMDPALLTSKQTH